ncbi:lactococcin 972 family bacteriocin [Actinosynnema sp. NPDC020468]|uniref:lactococcin 972 family bacteriocin n=1 Tax=Actinosynnema sp. NPDC020468 TaxID=3154488 RepID=UPI00340B5C8D
MRVDRVVKSALAAGALVLGIATPALATVVNVGGGTWDYGVDSARVWSNYYHGSKCHGSSVVGAYYDSSGDTRAGITARASAPAKGSGNKSYYRASC